jgi:hypothetical protein
MATIVTRHVVYSITSGRRNHHSVLSMPNIYVSPPGSYSSGNEVPINAPEFKVHNGEVLHFVFAAVKGTADGNHLYTTQEEINDPANEMQVGSGNIEVVVLYLPSGDGSGGDGFIVDAFNVDKADFSDSDFVDILNGSVVDASKTFTANEWGTIDTSLSAVNARTFDTVDLVPFLEWKRFYANTISMDKTQAVTQDEKDIMFAFYLTPPKDVEDPGTPITPPKLGEYKAGWIYVSWGVKVDGGGFVIGPNGPVPVGPWSRFWIRFNARISSIFNRGKAVSASDITSAAEQLSQAKALSQKTKRT